MNRCRFTLRPDHPTTTAGTLGPLYRILADDRITLFDRLMRDDAEWLVSVLNGYANNVRPATPTTTPRELPLVRLGQGEYTNDIAA